MYYPATNQYGCNAVPGTPGAWTGADAANIRGRIVLLDWKKAGDATFPCGSAERANNATAVGAIGIIMGDSVPFLDTAIGANATTPAMYTTSTVKSALLSQLAPGVVSTLNVTLSTLVEGQVVRRGPERHRLDVQLQRPAQSRLGVEAGHQRAGPVDLVAERLVAHQGAQPERDLDGSAAPGRRDGAPEAAEPDLDRRGAEGARDEHRGQRPLHRLQQDR